MNNLNEKLKLSLTNSKQNQHRIKNYFSHHHHHHQNQTQNSNINNKLLQYQQNIQRLNKVQPSSHSSVASDELETTSGSEYDGYQSNEYFKPTNQRIQQTNLQQPSQKIKYQLKQEINTYNNNNNNSSSTTTTSNENENFSDEYNSSVAKIYSPKAQKLNCKYCRSLTSYNNNRNKKMLYSTPKHLPNNNGNLLYGYSNINGRCDERMYAYDNFDCINECLEETENQTLTNTRKDLTHAQNCLNFTKNHDLHELDGKNDNSETENETDNEKCFSSILVEDGFIRMSSPVYHDKKDDREENPNIEMEKSNFINEAKMQIPKNNENKEDTISELNNFPNVGSSPLSEKFIDLNDNNTSSDEQDDEEKEKSAYCEKKRLFSSGLSRNQSSINKFINMSQIEVDRLLDSEHFDFDGIIHYAKNTNNINNEIISLSDEDDILVECDQNDIQNNEINVNDDENEINCFGDQDENDNFDIEAQLGYINIQEDDEGKLISIKEMISNFINYILFVNINFYS